MTIFSLLLGLGASLGLLRITQNVPRWQSSRWVNCGLVSLAGALVGARLSYVALHAVYYSRYPLEVLFIWQGGFSWVGALAGGVLSMAWIAYRWNWSFAMTADGMSPLVAPLAITAWLGCWASGVAYGMTLSAGVPWAIPARDEMGMVGLRLPVQLLGAFSLLIFYLWLDLKSKVWRRPGQHSSMAVLGLSFNLLIFSFLRADPAPSWGGLRPDTWAAMLCTLGSLGVTLLAFLKPGRFVRPSMEH